MGSDGGTIPERVTLVRELTNVHTKQRPSFLVRGRLAQTVKEEKDISDESNSLGLRHNKLKVIGFRKHYLLLQQTRQTIPKP